MANNVSVTCLVKPKNPVLRITLYTYQQKQHEYESAWNPGAGDSPHCTFTTSGGKKKML